MNNWNPPPGIKGWPSRYMHELQEMSDRDEGYRESIQSARASIREEEEYRAKQYAYSQAHRDGIVHRAMLRGRDYTRAALLAAATREGRQDIVDWLSAQDVPTFGLTSKGAEPTRGGR